MQTQTLVQASANVITITTLTAGDVYKRLVKGWNDEYKASFGVVQSVDFNGEDAMVTALEINEAAVESKVFGSNSNLQIFASTPEEVAVALAAHRAVLDAKRRVAADALLAVDASIVNFCRVEEQVATKRLTIPSVATTELTA